MSNSITIGDYKIGYDQPTFIIAEMSANHNQSFDVAVKTIKAVKETGADAIKLQTYTPDTITIDCDNEYFQIKQGTIWDGQTLYDLYQKAYTPWEWQPKLKEIAEDIGLICFSSPFDETSVDFLESMGVPAYKIASSEVVDIPLIQRIAATGKPIIISVGMASLAEIDEAISTIRKTSNSEIALLKCTCAYPALPEEMNLKTIPDLAEKYAVPVGISDHTLGVTVPVVAVALGARIVEKHFTLSRDVFGPDSEFSLEPEEFEEMVKAIRIAEKALGEISYRPARREEISKLYRKSLFITKDIKKGELLTKENIKSIRPGYGLHPRFLREVLGRCAVKNINRGTPLSWDLLT
jgi:pseudaminic acid synthase